MKRIISFVLCFAMCICMVSFVAASDDGLTDSGISYKDSTDSITTNPGRGQTSIGGWTVCSNSGTTKVLNPTGAYNTALYDLRCFSAGNQYESYHGSGVGGKDIPINAQTLEAIEQTLENARRNGAMIAFRFAYAYDESYGNEPADFNMLLYHQQQLAEVLNKYTDVVLGIEGGMVGPWGEMHSSKYEAKEYMSRIIAKWLECLDERIGIQIRAPQYFLSYYGLTSSSFMALLPMTNKKNFSRIGMYNDGYLGTFEDYGTFSNSDKNLGRKQAAEYLSYVEYVPYGGELAYITEADAKKSSPIYQKEYNMVKDFYDTHLSYLRNIATLSHSLTKCMTEITFDSSYKFDGMPDVSEYYGQNLQKFVYDHMGYRFVLRDSKLSASVAPGGELRLVGKIENTGFGNVLRDFETEILLYNKGTYYACPVSINPKTDIKTKTTYAYDLTLVLPKYIPVGNYEVFMRMTMPNDSLSDSTLFNIAFANDGVYQAALGANKIGSIFVAGTPESENEYFCEKENEQKGTATPIVISGYKHTIQATFGQKITLGYYDQVSDICYHIGGKDIDAPSGMAEITMATDTIGVCTVTYTDSKGKSQSKEFLTLNMKGHNYVESERVASTCTVPGKIIYKCGECGDSFESALPLDSHKYEPVINEKKCASVCSVCGDSAPISNYDDEMPGNTLYGAEPQPVSNGKVQIVGNYVPEYTFKTPAKPMYFALKIEGAEEDAIVGGLRTVSRSSTAGATKDSNASYNMQFFKGFKLIGDGTYIFAFDFELVNWDNPFKFGTISMINVCDTTVSLGQKSVGMDDAVITPVGVYESAPYYDVYFCDEDGNVLSHKSGDYSIKVSYLSSLTARLEDLSDIYDAETPAKDSVNGVRYTFKGWKTAKGDSVDYALGKMILMPDFEASNPECKHENVTVTDIEPTCYEEGMYSEICDDCGTIIKSEKINALGHKSESKVVVAATYAAKGESVNYCARCGVHLSTDAIDVEKSPFKDVTAEKWFANEVFFAVSNKLFNGTSANTFSPDESMTRGMLVTVLYRLDHDGADADNSVSKTFKDVEANMWYTGAIEWAAKNEIVKGMTETTFEPNTDVTREQAAVILYRYAAVKGLDTKPRTDLTVFYDYNSLSDWAETAVAWTNAYGIITGTSPVKLNPGKNASRAEVAKIFRVYIENVVNDFTVKY